MNILLYQSEMKSGVLDIETRTYWDVGNNTITICQHLFDDQKKISENKTISNCVKMPLDHMSNIIQTIVRATVHNIMDDSKTKKS